MVRFEIPMRPVSWMAPHKKKGHIFFNPRSKEKIATSRFIRANYHEEIINSMVILAFSFISKIPKSASKKKRQQMLSYEIFPTKMDVTNCIKFYEDCLKGIVITDDRNVIDIFAEKFYGEEDKVIIKVTPYEISN